LRPHDEILREARRRGVAVLLTEHTTYIAGRLLRLSTPAIRVAKPNPLMVEPDSLLKEFADELMEDKDGVAVVVDTDMRVEGVITRHDLINPKKKRVILVDHSELSQAVNGIEDAEIMEIVDHHRLGDIQTDKPIAAYVEPVGCTSTIIWGLFKLNGIKPTAEVAGLMLSAILSDTMLLKSPTATHGDATAVRELSNIVGIDAETLGKELYRAKMDIKSLSVRQVLFMDMKELRTPKGTIAISQVEVTDTGSILFMYDEIVKEMERISEERGYILFLLMVTDVLGEYSELVAFGRVRIVEKAFGVTFDGRSVKLSGVVSRKKQVIPPLLKSL
ncbi:MAG: DHH family phosphoesterase, partial [Synergistetes bacterium]|nr:DHH family phosphoesterase [Synergistota bacterium]